MTVLCHLKKQIIMIHAIQNSLIYLIINSKYIFYVDKIFILLYHILIRKIRIHGSLMV